MYLYGKTASHGIAVMSYLAGRPGRQAGSAEIADARSIPRPLAAKVLTQLAAAGFVRGQPGPGGGYTLAKDPFEISLLQIAAIFEQTEAPSHCPFGPGWCGGSGEPCPLHESIDAMQKQSLAFLENTRLSAFLPEDSGEDADEAAPGE
jgi:Rrf2 family protein